MASNTASGKRRLESASRNRRRLHLPPTSPRWSSGLGGELFTRVDHGQLSDLDAATERHQWVALGQCHGAAEVVRGNQGVAAEHGLGPAVAQARSVERGVA